MTSIGPNSPSTTTSDNSNGGTEAWQNPNNSQSQNDIYALAQPSTDEITHYLNATVFGFSIPAGATINGVVVEIDKCGTQLFGGGILDVTVSLVVGGSVAGDNKADTVTQWATTDTNTYTSYGNSTDAWNAGLTSTNVNASNFGVVISAKGTIPFGNGNAQIDHIRITVYYTAGAGGAVQLQTRMQPSQFWNPIL